MNVTIIPIITLFLKTMKLLITLLASFVFLNSCAMTTQYNEPPKNAPYATLYEPKMAGWFGTVGHTSVRIFQINGLAPDFYRWSANKHRINPGKHVLFVMGYLNNDPSSNIVAEALLEIDAKAGESYYLKMDENVENVKIYAVTEKGDLESEVTVRPRIREIQRQSVPIYIPTK